MSSSVQWPSPGSTGARPRQETRAPARLWDLGLEARTGAHAYKYRQGAQKYIFWQKEQFTRDPHQV